MRRYFLIFLVVLLSTQALAPVGARAATVKTFRKFSTHSLASIAVAKGDTLVVEPGVVITLASQGDITIAGHLIMLGTATNPIVVTGDWGTIRALPGSIVELANVRLVNFLGPLTVESPSFSLRSVVLQDGIHNTIKIMGEARGASYFFNGVVFQNMLRGHGMKSAGFQVTTAAIRLEHLGTIFKGTFPPGAHAGIQMLAPYNYLGSYGMRSDRGCSFVVVEQVVAVTYLLELDPKSCEPEAPVLFIPGYATSIHLGKLINPKALPAERTGWKFSKQITRSYQQLFETFTQNHIPFTVAYYDWRLPADQIVEHYIAPAIADLKQKTQSGVVTIVAHSFGGLLARAYLQSSHYQGDVSHIYTLGTPHQGSPKSYSVWEGGKPPPDWKILLQLVRYYQYREKRNDSPSEAIRRYFPSARELLPTYPFLKRDGILHSLESQQNVFLQNLAALEAKNNRLVPIIALYSDSETTLTSIGVGSPQPAQPWEDGAILTQMSLEGAGDATVPAEGAQLSWATMLKINGVHAKLPALAAETVTKLLRPNATFSKPSDTGLRESKDLVWFVADCPVSLTVTAPDGRIYTDTDPLDGESFVTDELTWLLVPEQEGVYRFEITAKAATEARFWAEDQPIQIVNLAKNQTAELQYAPHGALAPPRLQPQEARIQERGPLPHLTSYLLVALRLHSLKYEGVNSATMLQRLILRLRQQWENSS